MATTIELSEPKAVFLHSRAREARLGLRRSLATLPRNLEHALSPRAWTVRYPWASTGATVLGVLGLTLLVERRLARPHPAAQVAGADKRPMRSSAKQGVARRAGIKTARLARGALRRFVLQPLRTALIAHMRGLF